jgi:5-hydroxyisourate hydrolase
MSPITTHVLDTARGMPAVGVQISLEKREDDGTFSSLAQTKTNQDGRAPGMMAEGSLVPGIYRITFETAAYFATQNIKGFYPSVTVLFEIVEVNSHYHVPLLISPFGFSTYRGS